MRISKLCFILILSCYTFALSGFRNEIEMITDVIRSSDKVTSTVVHVCWKSSKQVLLMSNVMKLIKPKSIRFVNEDWINIEPMHRERVLIITDVSCPKSEEFLEKANALNMFAFPYRWLIIGKPIDESHVLSSEVYNLRILTDSDVIIAQKNDTNTYILTMIYKVMVNSTWQIENFGIWTQKTGLVKSKLAESSTSARRKNFKGATVKTAMVILDNRTKADPFDLSDVFVDTITKSSFRSTDAIYGYLNASKQLIFSETWGYYRNGTYGGMIAELTVGDADLAGTILVATQDRMEVLDYLSSPTAVSVKFVFREPPLSYQNNLFLLPFKTTVWYSIAAIVLVLAFVLYINALWENRKLDQHKSNALDPSTLKPNVSDIAILVISAISQQGSSTELKGTLGRIVMFLLFFAFLLLYSSYSASIVVLLQSSSNQIRTLSDLLSSKLDLGVEDTPYHRYFFAIATDPVRKEIYQTKIAPQGKKPKFMSIEEGVKKLQNEPFAFHMNKGIGYRLVERYFHEHEKCGLQEITYLYETKTYITCRKNSPYKEMFKVGLFRIKEHGMCDRENRLIYAMKPACTARSGSFGSVNMVDFHPVLLMYLYGIILAFLFLFLEIVVHNKSNRPRVPENIFEE